MKTPSTYASTLLVLAILFTIGLPHLTQAEEKSDRVERIMRDVEEIRGLKFKSEIKAEDQSLADFEKYLETQINLEIPPGKAKYYGRVIQKLGLYRGPVIEDFGDMVKTMFSSQAAAYYDPMSSTFFVVMDMGDPMMNDVMYAHELYHGLQDQQFDLGAYFVDPQLEDKINDDEALARQAVVEGEASLIMTLWMMRGMDTSQLGPLIQMQADMPPDTLRMMAKQQLSVAEQLGDSDGNLSDLERSLEALDDIPPFMIESMMGAYLKGMAFVYQVQQVSWDKVAELYTRPPTSTEQILHPEKWLEGEDPDKISFPAVTEHKVFEDWKVLEENTIGELQWRTIFNEHGMRNVAQPAAGGWHGDRFMVLEKEGTGDMLLLLYTTWDTTEDADEFFTHYENLLTAKYTSGELQQEMTQNGKDVLIIEGGDTDDLEGIRHFINSATKTSQ